MKIMENKAKKRTNSIYPNPVCFLYFSLIIVVLMYTLEYVGRLIWLVDSKLEKHV